jgi:hypothetical protein
MKIVSYFFWNLGNQFFRSEFTGKGIYGNIIVKGN